DAFRSPHRFMGCRWRERRRALGWCRGPSSRDGDLRGCVPALAWGNAGLGLCEYRLARGGPFLLEVIPGPFNRLENRGNRPSWRTTYNGRKSGSLITLLNLNASA